MRKEAERDEKEKKEVGREKERRENNGMRKGGNKGGGIGGEIKAVEKRVKQKREGSGRWKGTSRTAAEVGVQSPERSSRELESHKGVPALELSTDV